MVTAPTFVAADFDTISIERKSGLAAFGLAPFTKAPQATGVYRLLDLNEFAMARNPGPARQPAIVDFTAPPRYWPASLRLFRAGEHWFRSSTEALLTDSRPFEALPAWVTERLLLKGNWSEVATHPLATRLQPWREVSAACLDNVHDYPVSVEPLNQSPWLSVVILNSNGFCASSLAMEFDKIGFHSPNCEFISFTRKTGLTLSAASSSTEIRFEHTCNQERNLLLNFAARHARGDQLLIVENSEVLRALDASMFVRLSPDHQLIWTDGLAMIFRDAFAKLWGFTPDDQDFRRTTEDFATRLAHIHYRSVRL